MALADVSLEILALDADRPAYLASDRAQATGVTTQPAAPGGDSASAAVLVGDLAEAEKFGLAGHCGISVRCDAVMVGLPLPVAPLCQEMTFVADQRFPWHLPIECFAHDLHPPHW